MSEFNDYKWYNDESDNQGGENSNSVYQEKPAFYTEMINRSKKRKKKNIIISLVSIMAIVMVVCIGITSYVLISGNAPSQVGNEKGNTKQTSDPKTSFDFKQLSDGERVPMSTVDISTEVGPSVVGVNCKMEYRTFFGQTVEQGGSGSGIIISSDGYIATNNHVIEGAKSVNIVLNTGKEYEAKLVGRDPKTDLAVVKVEATDLPVAKLGDSDKVRAGELAVAIGNPLGQELAGTVTVGVISAVNRSITLDSGETMTLIQTDAAINPGNSGGALVNAYGEIVGINSMKFSGNNVEGIGFAIPINTAKPIVSDLIANGFVKGRPVIGISIREISPEIAAINDLPAGLQVADVAEGGAAQKAGVKKGDVIVSVDGKLVESAKQVNEIKDTHKAGDTLKMGVTREGVNMDFNIILQEEQQTQASNG